MLATFGADGVFDEALVLATCNRTEVYFVAGDSDDDPLEYILAAVSRITGGSAAPDRSAFYRHRGRAAVEHLFRVAAALDSQIVGEHQILGQLKDAYSLAYRARTAHLLLNKAMHAAFRVGKRVRTETHLGRGAAGVAQAAVELAQQVLVSLTGKSVLLVGAGQTAEGVATAAIRCGAERVVVANRSIDRAAKVVASVGRRGFGDEAEIDPAGEEIRCPAMRRKMGARGHRPRQASTRPASPPASRAITLDDIPAVIGEVDLLISATGSPEMVLTAETVGAAIDRSDRPLVIVDIAVPRDVAPELGSRPNVHLYNIDDLDRLVAGNLEARRREIPGAEAIVADELEQFAVWCDTLEITPTIKLLQDLFTQIQAEEVGRYGGNFAAADREQLERFTRSLCSKIMHRPVSFLRRFPAEAPLGDRLAAVDLFRRMFGLDDAEAEGD